MSSPLPYPLKDSNTGFIFETDFGLVYEISFTDDSGYLTGSSFSSVDTVFSFTITHLSGQIQHKDPRVESTIISALHLTFASLPLAVITYVCSLDDNQEKARNRLFHNWYLRTGKNYFVKLDHTSADERIYSSVIFRSDNPAREDINNLFFTLFHK